MAGLGGFLLGRFRGWINGGRPAGLTRGMSGRFAEQRFGLLSRLGGAGGGPGLGLRQQRGQHTLGGCGFLWHRLNLVGCGFFVSGRSFGMNGRGLLHVPEFGEALALDGVQQRLRRED